MTEPDHYFSARPAAPDERRRITVDLAGRTLQVQTAGGVFSPGHVDLGTRVLLREVPDPPQTGDLLDLGCGWGPLALTMALLAPDARVAGSRSAPVDTPAGQAAELATRAAQIAFSPLGGEASKAGDLAWTYGDAAWTADGKPARAHYVRIWQLRPAGWALVYDAILRVPPKS